MRKTNNRLLPYLAALALSLSCTGSLAVPKAAEDEDAPVSYGEAAAPPKPTSKAVAKQAAVPGKKAVERPQAGKKPAAAAPKTARAPTASKATSHKAPQAEAKGSTRKN